jgi:hypothetical protein
MPGLLRLCVREAGQTMNEGTREDLDNIRWIPDNPRQREKRRQEREKGRQEDDGDTTRAHRTRSQAATVSKIGYRGLVAPKGLPESENL